MTQALRQISVHKHKIRKGIPEQYASVQTDLYWDVDVKMLLGGKILEPIIFTRVRDKTQSLFQLQRGASWWDCSFLSVDSCLKGIVFYLALDN